MRKIDEIGICPNCDCSISIFKTQNYKRFAKCEICGMSYALPKRGSISNSALICPRNNFPLLIVERKNQPAYFWTDQPCFNYVKYDKYDNVKELISEFRELEIDCVNVAYAVAEKEEISNIIDPNDPVPPPDDPPINNTGGGIEAFIPLEGTIAVIIFVGLAVCIPCGIEMDRRRNATGI